MKTKDLINILKTGKTPLVKFNNDIYDFESADEGMMGKVIAYNNFDKWDSKNSTIEFEIDMSKFVNYNKKIAQPNWIDNNGNPSLIWQETKFYPEDNIVVVCQMLTENGEDADIKYFDIVEENEFFK